MLKIWVKKPDISPCIPMRNFPFFDAVKDQQNVDWTQQIQQGEFEDNILFWNAFMKNWEYIFYDKQYSGNVL